VFDEVAMWRDETSATPDAEIYTSVLPALLTTNGMLVGISTGYRRVGLLYQKHRDYFGVTSDDTLVVQGSTIRFNQTLDEAALAAQRAADPAAASSEWDGGFRDDIASFLDDELIELRSSTAAPWSYRPVPASIIARLLTLPAASALIVTRSASVTKRTAASLLIWFAAHLENLIRRKSRPNTLTC
jgi:hypothetical protein